MMKSKLLFIGSLAVLLALSFGTVGFSILELEERSASIDVAADDPNGLLALEPGASSVVEINGEDVLEINLADQLGSGNGVNPKSRLELGDSNEGTPEAFKATNTYDQDVDVNLKVENIQRPKNSNGDPVGKILVYQNGNEYEVTGSGTVPELTLASGESASYSLHFDTPGDIGTADAYQAGLTFEVSEA